MPTPTLASGDRSRPFTLIELLTVVAIISILFSILMPVFIGVKRRSRRTLDIGNHRQSVMALMMYAEDADGYLPPHPRKTENLNPAVYGGDSLGSLIDDLGGYITDFEIWKCAGLPGAADIDHPDNTRFKVYCTVTYFAGLTTPDFGLGHAVPDRLIHEDATSSMPVISCSTRDGTAYGRGFMVGHATGTDEVTVPHASNNPSCAYYRVYAKSQVEGSCISFMDGHTKWYNGPDLEDVGSEAYGTNVRIWAVLPK